MMTDAEILRAIVQLTGPGPLDDDERNHLRTAIERAVPGICEVMYSPAGRGSPESVVVAARQKQRVFVQGPAGADIIYPHRDSRKS